MTLKITSELQIAQCLGLVPGKRRVVKLQTIPNSTSSLNPLPFPPPQLFKVLIESKASFVIPTCFLLRFHSVQEGTDQERMMLGFGPLLVPALLNPRQVGRSVLFIITGQISYDIAYVWNLKKATNGLIYKTEIELQT